MTALDSSDRLEGVSILEKALLEKGPLPVRRLIGYVAHARKSVRKAIGKNQEELLQFLLADDGFIVKGDDNFVCINTETRSGSSRLKEHFIQGQKITSSVKSVPFSHCEKSMQIAVNNLPSTRNMLEDFEKLQGISILTNVLTRDGPLPLSTLQDKSRQKTRRVQKAVGGSCAGLMNFLRHDKHFIVVQSDDKCIIHLNSDVTSAQVPHPDDSVIDKKKSIHNFGLTNADHTDSGRQCLIKKSCKKKKVNNLPSTHKMLQDFERLEGISILTEVLTRYGPLPLSTLHDNLCQTLQNVQKAVGGSCTGLLNFLRHDKHFTVRESDDECIVHLNSDVTSAQVPHPGDSVVAEKKLIDNLTNADFTDSGRQSLIKKSSKEKPKTERSKSNSGTSSVKYLKEVVSTHDVAINILFNKSVLETIINDKHTDISVELLALQFIVNVIQMHEPVSVKVLGRFDDWTSRDVQHLLGKNEENGSFSKKCVKRFCRNHLNVLSYAKETKTISLIKSTSVNENSMHRDSLGMSNPNIVSEIAKSESFLEVPQAKMEQAVATHEIFEMNLDPPVADSVTTDIEAEFRALVSLKDLIQKFGPIPFDVLKALVLDPKYRPKSLSSHVMISFSECTDLMFLETAAMLRKFIMKHDDQLAIHRSKVYLVCSR